MEKETELKQEVQTMEEFSKAIIVSSKETVELASGAVMSLDKLIKEIKSYWKEPKEAAFQAHKSITKKESEMLKPVEDRRRDLQSKISKYLTDQEQIRREQQRKFDEERIKKEQAEKEKLEKQAVKAEEKGNFEKAELLREKKETVFVPASIVVPEVEKTTRIETGTMSTTKDIKITISDIKLILKKIIEGKIPETIVTINLSELKKFIKVNQFNKLDGCIIEEIISTSFRSK